MDILVNQYRLLKLLEMDNYIIADVVNVIMDKSLNIFKHTKTKELISSFILLTKYGGHVRTQYFIKTFYSIESLSEPLARSIFKTYKVKRTLKRVSEVTEERVINYIIMASPVRLIKTGIRRVISILGKQYVKNLLLPKNYPGVHLLYALFERWTTVLRSRRYSAKSNVNHMFYNVVAYLLPLMTQNAIIGVFVELYTKNGPIHKLNDKYYNKLIKLFESYYR